MKVEAGTAKNHTEYFVRNEEELKTVQNTLINNPDLSPLAQEVFSEPQANIANSSNNYNENSPSQEEQIEAPQTKACALPLSSSSALMLSNLTNEGQKSGTSATVSSNHTSYNSSLSNLSSTEQLKQNPPKTILSLTEKLKTLSNTHWQKVYKKTEKLLAQHESMKNTIKENHAKEKLKPNNQNMEGIKQLKHLNNFLVLEFYILSQKISAGFRNSSRLYQFLLKTIAGIQRLPSNRANSNVELLKIRRKAYG